MKDYQVRVVQEEIEAIVPKEARVCIGWAGLKHKTTKDRGRVKTMVSFWFSTLHRHDDDKGLENGETRLGIPELQSEWRDSEGEFGVEPSKKTVGQSTDDVFTAFFEAKGYQTEVDTNLLFCRCWSFGRR